MVDGKVGLWARFYVEHWDVAMVEKMADRRVV
jgi:hypothetical protein